MSAPLYLPAWKLYGAWPAAATDHRPHRGYPRTDQTRRIIYTRRRRSGDRPRSPNFPSMTLEATQPAGRISFCFVARTTCETVSIRHAMFSTSTRGGEREERFNMIYIYIARGGAGNAVGPFSEDGESVWKDSFVELRRGKNVDRDLGKNGKSLNPILGFRVVPSRVGRKRVSTGGFRYPKPRLWPTYEIRHAWPSCFRAPQFRPCFQRLVVRLSMRIRRRVGSKRDAVSRALVCSSRWSEEMEARDGRRMTKAFPTILQWNGDFSLEFQSKKPISVNFLTSQKNR